MTVGRVNKNKIRRAAAEAKCYDLMVGDMADIQVKEQNVNFMFRMQKCTFTS